MSALLPPPGGNANVPESRYPGAERIRANRSASKADETKRAFEKNWTAFARWCAQVGTVSLPASAETVEAYLIYLADDHPVENRQGVFIRRGLRPASVLQALWAINVRHSLASQPEPGHSPIVRTAIAGIRRRKAHRQKQQAPLTIEHISAIPFGSDLKSRRDKALLLVGFAGCFRRSELVALNVEDFEQSPYGLRVYLAQSKTDSEANGAWIDILRATVATSSCPVAALQQWLSAAKIESGPVFRRLTRGAAPKIGERLSAVSVDATVKWAAAQLGLPAAQYGGHSLRAGKATYLSNMNKPPALVAKHGRWKSMDMVVRYYRNAVAAELEGAY